MNLPPMRIMGRFFSKLLKHALKEGMWQDKKCVAVRVDVVDGEGGENEQHRVRETVYSDCI